MIKETRDSKKLLIRIEECESRIIRKKEESKMVRGTAIMKQEKKKEGDAAHPPTAPRKGGRLPLFIWAPR